MFIGIFNTMLRTPSLLIKNLIPCNIKAFFKKLFKGDLQRLKELVDIYMTSTAPLENHLTLIGAKAVINQPAAVPQYDAPLVSIVVSANSQWAYTRACVEAIIRHTEEGIPYEIIIAGSSAGLVKKLERYIAGTVYIRFNKKLRSRKNYIHAAQAAKGEYIVFLDNDTQVQPGWLEPLVQLMDSPSVGLAGPKLIYPNGWLLEAGGIIWNDGGAWNYGLYDDPSKPDYNYVKGVDYISAAAIMVRKTVLKALGGLSDYLAPTYLEDADLAFSIRELGYRVVYQPRSAVVHFETISGGTNLKPGKKRFRKKNFKKFWDKWQPALQKAHFPSGEHIFWARDRSAGKKTILFIDHYVPMYDKDAGSRDTYGYVRLCAAEGYHVLFLGDNFFPHQPYTSELQQMGVTVLYGTWYYENLQRWLAQYGSYIDVVHLNRPYIFETYIDLIREHTRAKAVYHGHDLHFVRLQAQYEIEKKEALLNEVEEWEARERKAFEMADLILTVSEKERPVIEQIAPGKPVRVIPIFHFERLPAIRTFSERRELLFVGGFGHPPNADAVLWFVKNVLPELPRATLIIAGANPPDEIMALQAENVIVKGYISDEELLALYASCRVAVVPLRFGAGVKGKVVEAISNLIPVVSTSFGLEGLPEIGSIITPRDDANGFAEEIKRLLASDEACAEAVNGYRGWIEKWFSRERALEIVREFFSDLEQERADNA